jgi:hypothetical protein
VLFRIDKSRGSQVLIEMLGREFEGTIGCDYFSAYRKGCNPPPAALVWGKMD